MIPAATASRNQLSSLLMVHRSSAVCTTDRAGEILVFRSQWAQASGCEGGWRRMRVFWGGDWLRIYLPFGFGGAKNKQFCMVCLASLHDTIAAGTPHLPHCPEGVVNPRTPHNVQPALWAETTSIRRQAKAYQQAVLDHSQES
eukprot:1207671-Pleurochrysis_carterae.AAC.1